MRACPAFCAALALLAGACDGKSARVAVTPTSVDPPRHVSVLTHHNDNARTGANLHEPELTPDVVRSRFGPLFTLFADGLVYAQPLVVGDLDLGPSGRRDVLFVATEHDTLYAFDADAAGPPLWQRTLGRASNLVCFPEKLLTPEIGITGTPVIDAATGTLYVVAYVQDDPMSCTPANFHQMLHAIDLSTGADRLPPVEIAAARPIAFDPMQQLQRSALLLSNGVVYVAFASHGGREPYHGWLFAFDAATLEQLAARVTTPSGRQGGIWMGGEGPSSVDDGALFVTTGNGSWDGVDNFADSLLELRLDGGELVISDTFTPSNQAELEALDLDLGSTGPLLVPGLRRLAGADRSVVVIAGKEGKMYLLDRFALGGFHADRDHVLQSVQLTSWNVDGSAVWFDDGVKGRVYIWGANADLHAFALADTRNGHYLSDDGVGKVPRIKGLPGGFLAISADGTSGGVLWANHPWSPDGSEANAIIQIVPGVLRAFDASNLGVELWNNRADAQAPSDSVGEFAKFCPPTVANGKVYQAAWKSDDPIAPGRVIVFGRTP